MGPRPDRARRDRRSSARTAALDRRRAAPAARGAVLRSRGAAADPPAHAVGAAARPRARAGGVGAQGARRRARPARDGDGQGAGRHATACSPTVGPYGEADATGLALRLPLRARARRSAAGRARCSATSSARRCSASPATRVNISDELRAGSRPDARPRWLGDSRRRGRDAVAGAACRRWRVRCGPRRASVDGCRSCCTILRDRPFAACVGDGRVCSSGRAAVAGGARGRSPSTASAGWVGRRRRARRRDVRTRRRMLLRARRWPRVAYDRQLRRRTR